MKSIKKATLKLLALTLIVYIIIISCTPIIVFASDESQDTETESSSNVTLEEARQNIANFAIKFQSEHSADCLYKESWLNNSVNVNGETISEIFKRRGDTITTPDSEGKTYEFDCVGWITFAISRGTGMECADPYRSGFVTTGGIKDSRFQAVSISDIIPGDVLWTSGHAAIYIGNDQVIDMWITDGYEGKKPSGGLKVRPLHGVYNFTNAARLISTDGVNFTPVEDGAVLPDGGSGNWDTDEVDLDEISDQFTFNGMPTTIIYEEQEEGFKWLFDGISGFMDFMVGKQVFALKSVILGYVSWFQRFINSFLTNLN